MVTRLRPCMIMNTPTLPSPALSTPPAPVSTSRPPKPHNNPTFFLRSAEKQQAIGLTPMDTDHADDDHATDDHGTSASDTSDVHHRRWLSGSASDALYTNEGSDGEATFILFGWVMLCTAIGNYIMSRWVEIRLLRKAGCNSTQDYQERLCVIEKHFMEAKVGSGGRVAFVYVLPPF